MTTGFSSVKHPKDMNPKERWLDQTLNSLEGINRAKSASGLYTKVALETLRPAQKKVPLRTPFYWTVAAGIAVLVTMNIFGVIYYNSPPQNTLPEITTSVASDYLSYLGPINL